MKWYHIAFYRNDQKAIEKELCRLADEEQCAHYTYDRRHWFF